MGSYQKVILAPTGSTGNNTHASAVAPESAEEFVFKFVVEAVGATPTVTYKFQGSPDTGDVNDANAAWFDVLYTTDATDTAAVATRAATAVGSQVEYLDHPEMRTYRRFRCVTSANTNVTYRAEVYALDHE